MSTTTSNGTAGNGTSSAPATNGTSPPRAGASSDGLSAQLAYPTRVLEVPTVAPCSEQLTEQARDQDWSHEEYVVALLARQVADRKAAGNTMRIRIAHFPAVKTPEDFNLDPLPSLRRDLLAHLAIGLGVKAAQAGTRSCSTPPATGSPASAPPTTPAPSRPS